MILSLAHSIWTHLLKNDVLRNLKIFSVLLKELTLRHFINSHKCKDKHITLVANTNLFAKLIMITQKRNIDLKEVFKYSLGPFPWAPAGIVGDLKKTN